MQVVSACPLPVASLLWQSQPSTWALTVVCRATILLLPGESVLAEHHEDPTEHDDHWDDDDGRSLRAASDLVPMKPRADVTLVGHAFAPGRAPVRSLVAHILIGELSKSVEVVSDRSFAQEGGLQDGPLFSRMPLVYERAAGGTGTSNPVGVSGSSNRFGRIALPNLQPPGLLVTSLDDYIAPIGFGPIAPGWPGRRERLGRASISGTPPDLSRPLPDDLDPQYWNHAPRDQQVQLLRDRERLILENLHPDHPRLVTDLPSLRPRAVVERQGRSHPVPLRCDTLWIDTDRALCTLTWRAQVPLKHPEEPGRVVFTLDTPGQTGARQSKELGRLVLRSIDPEDTAVPTERGAPHAIVSKVLPFRGTPPPIPRAPKEDKPAVGGLPFVASPPPSPRASVPAPAPYPMSPPAIPPPLPPPPRPSQPSSLDLTIPAHDGGYIAAPAHEPGYIPAPPHEPGYVTAPPHEPGYIITPAHEAGYPPSRRPRPRRRDRACGRCPRRPPDRSSRSPSASSPPCRRSR